PQGTFRHPCPEAGGPRPSRFGEPRRGGPCANTAPRGAAPPPLPRASRPRGLDNSSAEQVTAPADGGFGPLSGQMLHLSHGTGTYFVLLREKVDGQPQGAVVPMPGDFLAGIHRGRFNPKDGQLYASGMTGWGTSTPADGCFQRVRYTGEPAQVPLEFHAHENGLSVQFSRPLDRAIAEKAKSHFAQAWNYRYSATYGSPELSPRHAGQPGHDPLTIRSAHVLADGATLFLEIPDL